MPNRKDRRAQRSKERHARPFPSKEVALAAGKQSARTGELPPGYLDLIQRLARLILEWKRAEPKRPELLWHDMMEGPKEQPKTILIGNLQGESLKYIAGSPDAIRCLEWVDAQTNHEATLYQATWALKLAGELPGGPEEPKARYESWGHQLIRDFARKGPASAQIIPESPCPHCGAPLNAAGGKGDARPEPGNLSLCCMCAGISQYGPEPDLALSAFPEEAIAALDEEDRNALRDAQAMIRQAATQMMTGKHQRSEVEA